MSLIFHAMRKYTVRQLSLFHYYELVIKINLSVYIYIFLSLSVSAYDRVEIIII